MYKLTAVNIKMATFGTKVFSRNFSRTNARNFTVSIVGASGGIGQALVLLCKLNPLIKELRLHDLKLTKGVEADISHINTKTKTKWYEGVDAMKDAIKGCQLVLVTGGMPRKPGMTRDDLFDSNAIVCKQVAEAAAAVNPDVFVHITTNPVNGVVPVAGATYERLGKGNINHIFGISSLDSVRTSTFTAELKGLDPREVKAPVIGGHAGTTIIPLLSQVKPKLTFTDDEATKLIHRIQEAGTTILNAKAGHGTATLCMAFAAHRTADKFMKALKGETHHECLFIRSNVTSSKYFSTPLQLGKNGVEKNLGIPSGINAREKKQVEEAIKTLAKNIKAGEAYANRK